MEKLVKKSWFTPVAIDVAIVCIILLIWAFYQETYSSLKDDNIFKPPLEGTYFGMTIEEFCDVMDIEESDLEEAEPFDTAKYFNLESIAEDYGTTEDELRFYEKYENQYYFYYGKNIFGSENYTIDGRPLTVRLIFTNETSYKGKTIPPMLCAVFADLDRKTEDIDSLRATSSKAYVGKNRAPHYKTDHAQAVLLSYLYCLGKSEREIEELDIFNMTATEIDNMRSKLYLTAPMPILNGHIRVNVASSINNNLSGWKDYIIADAPYLAYYDWFINELT